IRCVIALLPCAMVMAPNSGHPLLDRVLRILEEAQDSHTSLLVAEIFESFYNSPDLHKAPRIADTLISPIFRTLTERARFSVPDPYDDTKVQLNYSCVQEKICAAKLLAKIHGTVVQQTNRVRGMLRRVCDWASHHPFPDVSQHTVQLCLAY